MKTGFLNDSAQKAYWIIKQNKKAVFVVTSDNEEAHKLYKDTLFFNHFFNKKQTITFFPAYEFSPYTSLTPSQDIIVERMRTIYRLSLDTDVVCISSSESLIQPMIPVEAFKRRCFALRKGEIVKLEKMVEKLSLLGYEHTETVSQEGDFSIRGGIIDVFSPLYDKPARIEFFGDEIEYIKLFHIQNQLSFKTLNEFVISPPQEWIGEGGYAQIIQNGRHYLSDNYDIFAVDNKDEVVRRGELIYSFAEHSFSKQEIRPENVLLDKGKWHNVIDKASYFIVDDPAISPFYPLLPLSFLKNISPSQRIKMILERSKKSEVVIACGSSFRRKRIEELFRDIGNSFSILFIPFYLSEGFYDEQDNVYFISYEDILGKEKIKYAKEKAFSIPSWRIGNLVVHDNYGIGVYKGIKRLNLKQERSDFVYIEYKDGDKLYVPLTFLHLLSPYYGEQQIDSLRSKKWHLRKGRAKRSIKKILSELVKLYAQREIIRRKPYEINTLFYREFSMQFAFQETPDQTRAISDIEKDMSKDIPMDRLICGDVSFGKTEVAMRACTICVSNDRQAAIIAPTTILVMQHLHTFLDRFSNFPVNIKAISRFTSGKEREEIIKGLNSGNIDIVIGTHSLLSSKIDFNNLGLLVIDEEQRFGVKAKEYWKERYTDIDVLSLSATPIPRTLNMSLSGVRDMSIIATSPPERKSIYTYVVRKKKSIIRDAIYREILRRGQVFFVHNRIEDIENVKQDLQIIVPDIQMKVIHGRLPKKKIKQEIRAFIQGEIPLIVSTAIVESGLDIVGVNTILIDDAQNFGLADLYQLRGRVGRGSKDAHCYLLVSEELNPKAKKRLLAIKEFIERGSSFQLAIEDMHIRGGGNLLGKDQSGHVRGIGYELYMQLVEEVAHEIKKEPYRKIRPVQIKTDIDVYIPDFYIPETLKLDFYRRLSKVGDMDGLAQIYEEMLDRFGKPPTEVENLYAIARIKILAERIDVKTIIIRDGKLNIEFYPGTHINANKLNEITQRFSGIFHNTSVMFNFNKIYPDGKLL
ncbi:MAG: DEAD/DEAH box helicase [Deltaproteobacteria bacterium]|nr:DEAD/DEAH box helicase [Deltaproteobacteria bacterium]